LSDPSTKKYQIEQIVSEYANCESLKIDQQMFSFKGKKLQNPKIFGKNDQIVPVKNFYTRQE
jgi:hypothetical protein